MGEGMFERLKKLWQECKDAVNAKHTTKMTPVFENEHETTQRDLAPQKVYTIHGDIEYIITTKCCICGTSLEGLVFDKNNSYSPYEEAMASLQVKQACSKKVCVIECEKKYYPNNFEKLRGICKGHGNWSQEDEIWERLIGAHAISDVPFNPKYKPRPPPSFGNEIASLVAEMNHVGIHTTCSCQGHGEAYVSIRLGEGTTYEHRKDIFGPGQDELVLRWKRKSNPAPACASDINTGFI